ncbi:hypothetical protein [Naasia aerilata]|uniref:Nucleoside 2-deoxyribosyltransferase n=1 Tax=Naasia aerilata TaxID=1162966 RepID=A0ABN6XLP8_9MICO|nr:hypothetical protein [Naasia aerilata]BDZ44288.1 hypothetical protein GCM10025866_01970 [Naasia aerilata]
MTEKSERPSAKKPDAAPKTLFVISPIGRPGTAEHHAAKLVLDYVIKKAFREPDWFVVRADEESAPDSITTQVIDRIVKSDLIVADLTDHNPNVFYEVALAHGYQKPLILMIREGQTIPFDVTDQRAINYELTDPASVDGAIKALRMSAAHLEKADGPPRTPLTAYGAFAAIATGGAGGDSNDAIALALQDLSTRLGRMERRSLAPAAVYETGGIWTWDSGAGRSGDSAAGQELRAIQRRLGALQADLTTVEAQLDSLSLSIEDAGTEVSGTPEGVVGVVTERAKLMDRRELLLSKIRDFRARELAYLRMTQ